MMRNAIRWGCRAWLLWSGAAFACTHCLDHQFKVRAPFFSEMVIALRSAGLLLILLWIAGSFVLSWRWREDLRALPPVRRAIHCGCWQILVVDCCVMMLVVPLFLPFFLLPALFLGTIFTVIAVLLSYRRSHGIGQTVRSVGMRIGIVVPVTFLSVLANTSLESLGWAGVVWIVCVFVRVIAGVVGILAYRRSGALTRVERLFLLLSAGVSVAAAASVPYGVARARERAASVERLVEQLGYEPEAPSGHLVPLVLAEGATAVPPLIRFAERKSVELKRDESTWRHSVVGLVNAVLCLRLIDDPAAAAFLERVSREDPVAWKRSDELIAGRRGAARP